MEERFQERHLPADLSAPAAVLQWRRRAGLIAVGFAVLAVIDLIVSQSFDYLLRGWLMGLIL